MSTVATTYNGQIKLGLLNNDHQRRRRNGGRNVKLTVHGRMFTV